MQNTEHSQKKAQSKGEKRSLTRTSLPGFEPMPPAETTIKSGSILNPDLFEGVDTKTEKIKKKVPIAWDLPKMCPEFGL